MTDIVKIQKELTAQLANKEVFAALVNTTFKGLDVNLIKRALMEGMMRGFKFDDFLKKNIYAIPFRDSYTLVTSIDYARKIGMRSGVVGKSEPLYQENGKEIISCSITIKRKVKEYIGEYSATVYFKEYTTGKNLWLSKPRTMIAKVAEMHALRMACPEELSQMYTEDEMEKEDTSIEAGKTVELDVTSEEAEQATITYDDNEDPKQQKVKIAQLIKLLGVDFKDKKRVNETIETFCGDLTLNEENYTKIIIHLENAVREERKD